MKSKVFAVVLAVMALVSCMCIPALAAEKTPVVNGVSFAASHWKDNESDLWYLEIETGVTYTITISDPSITYMGTWVYKSGSRANGHLDFVDGVCQYTCTDTNVLGIVIKCDDAQLESGRPTITVTWPQPSIFERLSSVSTALWDAAGDAVAFVMETPLAQVSVSVGLIVIGCIFAKKYLFAQ